MPTACYDRNCTSRGSRLEVVDGVLREVAQPLLLGHVVVVADAQSGRELGEDRAVVAAFVHRLDGLLHVDRIVAGGGPQVLAQMASALLPEGCAAARSVYTVPANDSTGEMAET